MYPMLWQASGVPLEDLVHRMVEGARESMAQRNPVGAPA
jgi:hypothetical protein